VTDVEINEMYHCFSSLYMLQRLLMLIFI